MEKSARRRLDEAGETCGCGEGARLEKMKVVALLNASARLASREERLEERVRRLFAGEGIEADVRTVSGPQLEPLARAALASDADAVVVGGGDGSVGCVAGALADQDKALGVLPLGTLNHFARDLGMPSTLDAAVRAIARGTVRRVDVGEVNGRVFVNNSSIGLYPHALKLREERRARGRNKWIALAAASAGVFLRYPLTRVRLSTEGRSFSRTTPFVFVGNNRYDFTLLMPRRASLEEGLLYVYVAGHHSRAGILLLAQRALAGRLEQARDLELFTVCEVMVEPSRPWVQVALDGEAVAMKSPLRYRIRPQALRVIVPRKTVE
ncbi:MAG: diacylglycerol/lipid kinase family protein [Myxococcales bacterium]